jgi:hypothetical protein
MSCDVTVRQNQTEFEFLQQLRNNSQQLYCCGPITDIIFTRHMVYSIKDFLNMANRELSYLDNFAPVPIDSEAVQLSMCARHWLQHADLLHKTAHITNRQDFNDISFFLFKSVCLSNSWDEKELSNYLG